MPSLDKQEFLLDSRFMGLKLSSWILYLNFLIVLVALLAFSDFSFAESKVVSETLGQVRDSVVTSREVKLSKLVEVVLYPAASTSEKTAAKNMEVGLLDLTTAASDSAFQSALTSVLLESVVAFEAEAFNLSEVSEEDLVQAVEKVQSASSFKSGAASLEVTSEELKKLIKRKIVAKSFLKFKTNSMVGVVTDVEVKNYFEQNRNKFPGESVDPYKENIRKFLMQQQLEERLRSWFEVIQRKYKVRNFVSDKVL